MEDFDTMIEYFEERLKERMTFVLCFSPLGSMLRETLHEYTGFRTVVQLIGMKNGLWKLLRQWRIGF